MRFGPENPAAQKFQSSRSPADLASPSGVCVVGGFSVEKLNVSLGEAGVYHDLLTEAGPEIADMSWDSGCHRPFPRL